MWSVWRWATCPVENREHNTVRIIFLDPTDCLTPLSIHAGMVFLKYFFFDIANYFSVYVRPCLTVPCPCVLVGWEVEMASLPCV